MKEPHDPRPVDDDERAARMLFSGICEPGDADACRLVREHGARSVIDRIGARRASAGKLGGWAVRLAATSMAAVRSAADAAGARYLCPGDPDWPVQLDDLQRLESDGRRPRAGAPFGLWVRGSRSLTIASTSVSIVGSRACSSYGDHVAGDLAYFCGARGWTTVSGGAYGIDAAAHRGALAGGHPTIAVLAGGIDRLYPAGNTALLEAIDESGLLLAEAAPGAKPIKSRFLTRNRLIAALGTGTVVVEAAVRSGALSTARWALDIGRPVMGVPGPVTSNCSRGVHELLRQPGPVLVTDVDEVIEHLSPVGSHLAPAKTAPGRLIDTLSPHQRAVLEAMPLLASAGSREISVAAGLGPDDVATVMGELTALGLVAVDSGGWRLTTSAR